MYHNVGVMLNGLLRVLLFTIGRLRLVHLHVIAAFFLALFILVIFALALFDIDLLAFGVCSFLLGRSSSLFTASHLGVFAISGSSVLSFYLLLFILLLVDTVLVTICGQVRFGLVRGELWWSRLLRIPVIVSCCLDCLFCCHTIL